MDKRSCRILIAGGQTGVLEALRLLLKAECFQIEAVTLNPGSSTTADRAKSLKGFRISTASQFTLRVITDSVTTAYGLTTYLILGGANCRI